MSNALTEYQNLIEYLHDQTLALGVDGYWSWVHSLPDEDAEVVINAMSDPAFSLQAHQIMPRLDDKAFRWDGQGFEDHNRIYADLPIEWRIWFMRMGRGAGKTHAASTNANLLARYVYPGLDGMLVGPDYKHVREVMIEGESGIINTAPEDFKPRYYPGSARVVWPNGSKAIIYTSDDPESIRGPSLYWAWGDELAKWKSEKSFKNLVSTLRNKHQQGNRLILTTSPISSQKWVRAIEQQPNTITTVATSFTNVLGLDSSALEAWQLDVDQGSHRAREEYLGEWIDETDKLWTVNELDMLVQDKASAVTLSDMCARMDSRLLSIDPGGKRDLNGIVLLGIQGNKKWVLADFSMPGVKSKLLPRIKEIFTDYMKAGDRVVVETNAHQGIDEDLKALLAAQGAYVVPIQQNGATGSKEARAQRAQQLYENNEVVHFRVMPELHQQMESFYEVVASKHESPDRVDALVNGLNWYQDNKKASLFTFTVSSPVFRY